MNKEWSRQALVDALRHPTPKMRMTLRKRKKEGERELERPDFVWHLLLQSFATWGGSRGWEGLIGTKENYDRVTFSGLSRLEPEARHRELEEVFLASGVRYARLKANLMAKNHELVAEMGGPEEVKRLAFAQEGKAAKIAFMKRFHGIGDKYARNIWMDCYHPDFRDAVAVDERIKKVTEALGYSFASYDEHERFYQGVAAEANLEPWEVDRLLYNQLDEFLAAVGVGEEERSAELGGEFMGQQGEPLVKESPEGVANEPRISADDLIALSGLPRALDILEETMDADVREELARFVGNKPERASANLMQEIRADKGYWVYANLDKEHSFGCYIGYAMRYPDGYPRLQVGLYAKAGAAESEVARAAIEGISRLEGWQLDTENTAEHEVRRERSLASLLGEEDHFVAAKAFFIRSIRQSKENLIGFDDLFT